MTDTIKLPLPPAKAYLYNQNRRNPITHRRNRGRGCLCFCFWLTLIIIFIIMLATLLYLLYRPHRPEFSVTSLKISKFNLTTATDGTTRLTANLSLTMATKNPNYKIEFYYDRFTLACVSVTDGTDIANGYSEDNLVVSEPNNVTIIHSLLSSDSRLLETETVSRIRLYLKRKLRLKLKILLNTRAVMKVGSFKSKKVGIRIKCDGVRSVIPKSGGAGSHTLLSSLSTTVSDAKCEVDFQTKIWKWTF
ncbi:NDR1/HIN1-like protein 13 [Bidens hawaiensis]|uniref:NDR1/HIN1-like protein 13 n=1 Tax=Bidens hawaiensis TaxID=980011 RepID=UPI00404B71A9